MNNTPGQILSLVASDYGSFKKMYHYSSSPTKIKCFANKSIKFSKDHHIINNNEQINFIMLDAIKFDCIKIPLNISEIYINSIKISINGCLITEIPFILISELALKPPFMSGDYKFYSINQQIIFKDIKKYDSGFSLIRYNYLEFVLNTSIDFEYELFLQNICQPEEIEKIL